MTLFFSRFHSPVGEYCLARTEIGICWLAFSDTIETDFQQLQVFRPDRSPVHDPAALAPLAEAIWARDTPPAFKLDLAGTPFQRLVWSAVQKIPFGQTASYTEIAHLIGQPQAVRAVATAIGQNPIAVLIPCHRILRANGHLGGYRWGPALKQRLLNLER